MSENKRYDMMIQCADKLDSILCSYQGRGHQSVYIDMDSLALFVGLLLSGEIKPKSYQYSYDFNIYEDEIAVDIYEKLAPQTRWRIHSRTEIEPIRMNALRQFAHMGTPEYMGNIYYSETEAFLICGEILPYEIIQMFINPIKIDRLYVFPYPHRVKDEKDVYYSFEFTDVARGEMTKYMERIFDKIRGKIGWGE